MGFLDKIFSFGKAYSGGSDPKFACEMTVEGRKYLLEEFDLDFSTEESRLYIPMYAVFGERLEPEIEAWITRSGKRRDGKVRFYRSDENPVEGAVFELAFYDAVCLRYRRQARGNTPLTTLVLAAKRIRLLEEEFEMK